MNNKSGVFYTNFKAEHKQKIVSNITENKF